MKLHQRQAFSYLDDPAVPALPEGYKVVFMDGGCLLCSRAARTIARRDNRDEFRVCTTASPLGSAVLTHYGLDPHDPDSWLYLDNGVAYTSLDAVARVGRRLGGWTRLFGMFTVLPRAAQDWLYARIARNRYRLFGRADMCALPDPALQRRLIG